MATRLSVGGATSSDLVPLNLAAGAEPRGPPKTNLSGSNRPTQSTNLSSQVEYFADELVLGDMEKHQVMGVHVSRRMSRLLIVFCCIAIVVVAVILGMAFSGGNSSDSQDESSPPPVQLSYEEGQKRYESFRIILEPMVGGSVTLGGTPEADALFWLAYDDPAQIDPHSKIDKIIQRFVLASLYYATIGDGWDESHNFLSSHDECDWNHGGSSSSSPLGGAFCKGGDRKSVDTLILPKNNLHGSLPRDIGLLTHLSYFDVSQNEIRGLLPSTISLLSKLTHLDVGNNYLEELLPSNIQKFTNLDTLKVNNNTFEGVIPMTYIVGLPSIKEIDMSDNAFSGFDQDTLDEVEDLPKLERLNLGSNAFRGPIPSIFNRFTSLKILNLSNNLFTGSLPTVFGQMPTLQRLDVSYNQLSGNIPLDFFGDSSTEGGNMVVFRASSNNLIGQLPTQFGLMQTLNILALDDNGLDGTIPTEIGSLSRLQILDLSKNAFAGSIPTTIKTCQSLISLNLSHNKLDGRLPTELGALGSVDQIDLRNNLLDASLPTQLRNLPELTKLYLSSNSFVGNVDDILCNRPEKYLPWITLESDCLTDFISCSCCTSCCNGQGGCCTPGAPECMAL